MAVGTFLPGAIPGVAAPAYDRYDFSNPFISAVIVTEEGRFPLWTNNETSLFREGGSALEGTRALAFLSELVVEIQLAYLPRITATLTPPYRDAINFLDSTLMNWGTSTLEVQFGYISNTSKNTILSPVFSGVLLKPEVNLGSDVIITLNAQGVSGLSASQQAGTRTFNGKTRADIITAIAEGRVTKPRNEPKARFSPILNYSTVVLAVNKDFVEKLPWGPRLRSDPSRHPIAGFEASEGPPGYVSTESSLGGSDLGAATREVVVDFSEVRSKGDQETIDALFNEAKTSYVQGGLTDWQAIWRLCEEARCYFIWEGNSLRIFPKSRVFVGEEPKRFLRLYDYPAGIVGPANGYFPILSASSPTMAVYLPGASKGLQVRGVNPDTRQEEVVNVNDATEKIPRLQEGGVAPTEDVGWASADDATGDGQTTFPGESSDPDVKKMMQSEFKKAASNMGINLVVETLADPKILPGDVVDVSGIGQRLSRKYVTTKITYTFGLSGSLMSLECVSDSSPVNNFVQNQGKATKTPDAPSQEQGTVVEAEEQA